MHLTGPFTVLLPVFTLGSCLFDLLTRFISSRIKTFRDQTTIQQGSQLLEKDRTPINNLDVTVQVPRDNNRKGAIFLIRRVYSPLSSLSSYRRWTTPLPATPKKKCFGNIVLQGEFEIG
jgi:hypothetical protein